MFYRKTDQNTMDSKAMSPRISSSLKNGSKYTYYKVKNYNSPLGPKSPECRDKASPSPTSTSRQNFSLFDLKKARKVVFSSNCSMNSSRASSRGKLSRTVP